MQKNQYSKRPNGRFLSPESEVSELAVLKNPRWEKFVQSLITGVSQRKAYRSAYPNSEKWKDDVVDQKASKLLNENGKVLARYQELQEESKSTAIMAAIERKKWLSGLIRGEEEKTENKLKAIDILNKMDGEYTQKIELSKPIDDSLKEMEEYFESRTKTDS